MLAWWWKLSIKYILLWCIHISIWGAKWGQSCSIELRVLQRRIRCFSKSYLARFSFDVSISSILPNSSTWITRLWLVMFPEQFSGRLGSKTGCSQHLPPLLLSATFPLFQNWGKCFHADMNHDRGMSRPSTVHWMKDNFVLGSIWVVDFSYFLEAFLNCWVIITN